MIISRPSNLTILHRSLSVKIGASSVKALRDSTGAPMMDCKKALSESEGDIDKAVDWLRAKGIAKAAKSTDREASEGLIAIHINKALTKAVLVEINSETDFVARNAHFHTFVDTIAKHSFMKMDSFIESQQTEINIDTILDSSYGENGDKKVLRDSLFDTINTIRENIVVKRITGIDMTSHVGNKLGYYMHTKVYDDSSDGGENESVTIMGRTCAIVNLNIPESIQLAIENENIIMDMGKRLAMHVVAASPTYTTKEEVPIDVIEREKSIMYEQMKETETNNKKPKPADVLEKIIIGKMNKRLSELCLDSQPHVAEEGNPVIHKYLKNFSKQLTPQSNDTITINGFVRWDIGS
jgi:elongation factor Ts